jgi:putative membrane protein
MVFAFCGALMPFLPLSPETANISGLAIVFFALPAFVYVIRSLGWRRGFAAITVLGAFALAIETLALKTGFPYGRFTYGEAIGGKLFGVTPWSVAFAWSPIVIGAYAIADRGTVFFRSSRYAGVLRFVSGVLLIVLADVVLDPGAVLLGLWTYDGGGVFYDVPWSNFGGWILSGALGIGILSGISGGRPLQAGAATSYVFIVCFWTVTAAITAMAIPAAVGLALAGVSLFVLLGFTEPDSK